MLAYKLFEIDRNDRLYSLFINKRDNPIPQNVWLEAELHPTKGFAARKGWHCCTSVNGAPHLKKDPKNGRKRVWAVVEVEGIEVIERPESQGGIWYLAERMRVVGVVQSNGTVLVSPDRQVA